MSGIYGNILLEFGFGSKQLDEMPRLHSRDFESVQTLKAASKNQIDWLKKNTNEKTLSNVVSSYYRCVPVNRIGTSADAFKINGKAGSIYVTVIDIINKNCSEKDRNKVEKEIKRSINKLDSAIKHPSAKGEKYVVRWKVNLELQKYLLNRLKV